MAETQAEQSVNGKTWTNNEVIDEESDEEEESYY